MTIPSRRSCAIALGLVVATLAASAGFANSATGTTQCGIATSTQGGMLALEGTIMSPVALSGEYRFAIQSSSNGGSSNISQGGGFAAAAGETTTLGKVMINAGSHYDLVFDVTADGKKLDCSQEFIRQL